MIAEFVGDAEKYGLIEYSPAKPIRYDIDFRSEGTLVYVEAHNLDLTLEATLVHVSLDDFFASWRFVGDKKQPKAVRKTTDFESTLYFTVGEVAAYFGVTRKTVLAWEKSGRLIPARVIPPRGDRRYYRNDIKVFEQKAKEGL